MLGGWRNLTTPRPGVYDPSWVCGARYFVLNDHWGGKGWAQRARAEFDEQGKLKGYHLDGYFIGTSDPNFIKPLLRPWGLIDIHGRPKGDTILAFPPYIPKHRFEAALHEELPTVGYCPRREELTAPEVEAGRAYRVTVEFMNLEDAKTRDSHPFPGLRKWVTVPSFAMEQVQLTTSERVGGGRTGPAPFVFEGGELRVDEAALGEKEIAFERVGGDLPERVGPGETVRLEYEMTFSPALDRRRDDGRRHRVRPCFDLYYVWEGRPYHTDAWLPRVVVDTG